jgi:hypothetical protein
MLLAVAPAAIAASPAPSPLEAFQASDAAEKLRALGCEVVALWPYEGKQVLVGYYIPELGPLNEWDDETRIDLFEQVSPGTFTRVQFVTKAGSGLPGRPAGVATVDMDGDGLKEIIAVSRPFSIHQRVTSLIFRKTPSDSKLKPLWKKRDLGAALLPQKGGFLYSYQTREPELPRVFETYRLLDGEFKQQQSR